MRLDGPLLLTVHMYAASVTYDLMFARRQQGQTWDDVLEAAEDDDKLGVGPNSDVWQRVADRTSQLLGDVSLYVTDQYGEINHEPSNIQIDLSADSAEMRVPYGATGNDATAILQAMYLVGIVIEEETGLEGYDPQVGKPLREAATDLDLGSASFETVGHMLRNRSRRTV